MSEPKVLFFILLASIAILFAQETESKRFSKSSVMVRETTTCTHNSSSQQLSYDFATSLQGWVLPNTNGIRWIRSSLAPNSSYSSGIQIESNDLYSDYAEALSPLLQTLKTNFSTNDYPQLEITFLLKGTESVPASLKLFQHSAGSRTLIVDLTPLGHSTWTKPLTLTLPFPSTPNVPFQLVLEGYTGQTGQKQENTVHVSKIVLKGMEEITYYPDHNITSWTEGYTLGSRWIYYAYQNIWTVGAGTASPGMATLESWPLPPSSLSQKVSLQFKLSGSVEYPAELTLRKRTVDGIYDDEPFMDLRHYGSSGTPDWTSYTAYVDAAEDYQIVLEGYIAAPENKNDISIKELLVESYDTSNTLRRFKLI